MLTDIRGTAARCYLQEESPQGHQGDQGFRIQGYGTQLTLIPESEHDTSSTTESSLRLRPASTGHIQSGALLGIARHHNDTCTHTCDQSKQVEDHELIIHAMQGTSDVRVDPQLNKKVWEQGVKGVPYRLRVRISRRRNDEEGAKEKLYSYVQAVNVKNPKGLLTSNVDEEEA